MSTSQSDGWTERRSGGKERNEHDRPSPYERDRARILHSAAFRRLQGKTQVLGISETDFHRTRLTHSLEVAQIGRGIVSQLRRSKSHPEEFKNTLPSYDLIEAICLAHDVGHPPFGHGGEVALDFIMRLDGGFEGNGQTLRRLARHEPHTREFGLDLTRRTLLGILKYPIPYSKAVGCRQNVEQARPPRGWKPPKCFLDDEQNIVDWIVEPFDLSDRARLFESTTRCGVHVKPDHMSLDTSILNLADDIAYGVHDLEDGIYLTLINRGDWQAGNLDELAEAVDLMGLQDRLFGQSRSDRKKAIGDVVHMLLRLIYSERKSFSDPLLKWNAELSPAAESFLSGLKQLTRHKLIERAQNRTAEWRGQEMIRKLFPVFEADAESLTISRALEKGLIEAGENVGLRRRAICDYIASMTDEYAVRMYERLFVPRQRTVFDYI